MNLLLFVLLGLIFLILSYPFWLFICTKYEHPSKSQNEKIEEVSLVFLSYNGGSPIKEKIQTITEKLNHFKNWELIIIDNSSNRETKTILNTFRTQSNLKIIFLDKNIGVANAMNLGVKTSTYKYLIFCDQRQILHTVNFDNLLSPLISNDVGAVSAKISSYDKEANFSIIRAYENYVKKQESKFGSVIGVYGPLFALKKEVYKELPEHIILDDLYLSLTVLQTKKILFASDVVIIDDNFNLLYNEKRATSYFQGLHQLYRDTTLIKNLSIKNMVLLFWHKYLRLLIPLLLFVCALLLIFHAFNGNWNYILSLVLLVAFLFFRKTRSNLMSVIIINYNYFMAVVAKKG
jgi:glycosyltransferase involved in cell wall biosynthesis